MNSEEHPIPFKITHRRPDFRPVNHRGTPGKQPRPSTNPVLTGQLPNIEDEVVGTSDTEELAFDLALQRPSYWLAPSLYPVSLHTTDPDALSVSNLAVGPSQAQPETVRHLCYIHIEVH